MILMILINDIFMCVNTEFSIISIQHMKSQNIILILAVELIDCFICCKMWKIEIICF